MLTPCATCTRLSIFVPAPMRVSPTAGRSTAACAPISTSSSITTRPTCGIFWCVPSGRRAKPKPSLPIDGGVLHDHAVADRHAFANRHVRVDDAVVADRRAGADRRRADGARCARRCARAGRRRRTAPIDDVGAELGRRIDAGERADAGRRAARAASAARPRRQTRDTAAACAGSRTARRSTVSSAMTAEARVAASFDAYFGLARNVTSPGPASSRPATRATSIDAVALEAAAESRGQISERHGGASITPGIGHDRRRGRAFDEQREIGQAERGADVLDFRGARVGGERHGRVHRRERRGRAVRPRDLRQAVLRPAHREEVADGAEHEIVRRKVRTGDERERRAQQREQRVDHAPQPALVEVGRADSPSPPPTPAIR